MTQYVVKASDKFTLAETREKWCSLYSSLNNSNVFLDWFWIGPWLKQVSHLTPTKIEIYVDTKLVAMGFICFHTRRIAGLPIRQGYLNRTGKEEFDQIWIEFNDLLVSEENAAGATQALLGWCHSQRVDEWIIALTEHTNTWIEYPHFAHSIDTVEGYSVNLQPGFSHIDNYLRSISSNARSKIRRAHRYISETYGEVVINVQNEKIEEQDLANLMVLHKRRWSHTLSGSGFTNPHFVSFHKTLLTQPSAHSRVEILCFKAGNKLLGYLYNFITEKKVSFYLSAIDYFDDNNRFQPGLVMHSMAICHYAQKEMLTYDFMGGDNQYKRSLATEKYQLSFIKLHTISFKYYLLQTLRKLKSVLFKSH